MFGVEICKKKLLKTAGNMLQNITNTVLIQKDNRSPISDKHYKTNFLRIGDGGRSGGHGEGQQTKTCSRAVYCPWQKKVLYHFRWKEY